MPNRPPSTVEKLSEEARVLVHQMLDQGAGPTAITKAVRQRTGEIPSASAVARYASSYSDRQKRRQEARNCTSLFVEQVRQQGGDIPELLRAAFLEAFTAIAENGKWQDIKLLDWDAAERKRRELRLKEKQTELAERRVKVSEQRLKLIRDKAKSEIDKLERKAQAGKSLSPEDVRRIREIYGLYEETPHPTEDSEPEPSDGNNE